MQGFPCDWVPVALAPDEGAALCAEASRCAIASEMEKTVLMNSSLLNFRTVDPP